MPTQRKWKHFICVTFGVQSQRKLLNSHTFNITSSMCRDQNAPRRTTTPFWMDTSINLPSDASAILQPHFVTKREDHVCRLARTHLSNETREDYCLRQIASGTFQRSSSKSRSWVASSTRSNEKFHAFHSAQQRSGQSHSSAFQFYSNWHTR